MKLTLLQQIGSQKQLQNVDGNPVLKEAANIIKKIASESPEPFEVIKKILPDAHESIEDFLNDPKVLKTIEEDMKRLGIKINEEGVKAYVACITAKTIQNGIGAF